MRKGWHFYVMKALQALLLLVFADRIRPIFAPIREKISLKSHKDLTKQ